MAEGGSSSIYSASADIYCDLCFEDDGTKSEVTGFCRTCKEHYCSSCLKSHRRSKMTQNHKIESMVDKPAEQTLHTSLPTGRRNAAQKLSAVKINKVGKIKMRIDSDTKECLIIGVDVMADGSILVGDNWNSSIKLFSKAGLLLSSLKLNEKPEDVCVINEKEAAVCFGTKQIQIIDIADKSNIYIIEKYTISVEKDVFGITVNKENLVITCGIPGKIHTVQMIDIDGKVTWSRTNNQIGNSLFDKARYVTTQTTGTGDRIVVTDWRKCTITILDAKTGNVIRVCEIEGKIPKGVAVDGKGNVFALCPKSGEISGKSVRPGRREERTKSGDISMWSPDMTEERYVETESESLASPCAMVYHKGRSELLVACRAVQDPSMCNYIHRYKVL